MFNVIVHIFLN